MLRRRVSELTVKDSIVRQQERAVLNGEMAMLRRQASNGHERPMGRTGMWIVLVMCLLRAFVLPLLQIGGCPFIK